MANENVSKFEELLRGSEEIQAKLQELAQAFEGEKDDAKAFFDATIGKLAEEHGLPFTFEEGAAYAAADRNLSDDELDAVAGGSVCYFVCASPKVENDDCIHHKGSSCAYVGVTVDNTW